MGKFRKLKIILNKVQPHKTRVVDSESGEVILGHREITLAVHPAKVPTVTIAFDLFDIEIEQESEEGQ